MPPLKIEMIITPRVLDIHKLCRIVSSSIINRDFQIPKKPRCRHDVHAMFNVSDPNQYVILKIRPRSKPFRNDTRRPWLSAHLDRSSTVPREVHHVLNILMTPYPIPALKPPLLSEGFCYINGTVGHNQRIDRRCFYAFASIPDVITNSVNCHYRLLPFAP